MLGRELTGSRQEGECSVVLSFGSVRFGSVHVGEVAGAGDHSGEGGLPQLGRSRTGLELRNGLAAGGAACLTAMIHGRPQQQSDRRFRGRDCPVSDQLECSRA